jgi:preprotein translocase subunit SecF
VVVFDKVRENVRDLRSSTARTYSEAANLAVNQVLVRSINTTVIGVLPVAALLFAGAVILGEGPLKDLALALFVGMVSGAYSSIFIATPLLAQLREREPDMKKLASRVATRRSKESQKDQPGQRARRPAGQPAVTDPAPAAETRDEPDDSELAEAALGGRPGIKISRMSAAERPDVRPLSDGAAKRPQPQHKPRSQRKK